MAQVSKWHRTSGGMIPDPHDEFFDKDFSRGKLKKTPAKDNEKFTIHLELELDPKSKGNLLRDLKIELIKACLEEFDGGRKATANAVGLSPRAIQDIAKEIEESLDRSED